MHVVWIGLLFASHALADSVSYDGVQVVRLPTGEDPERISDIIARLELDTWKHTDSFADIAVPLNKLDAFENEIMGLDVTIMHKDLGNSIAVEKRSVIGADLVAADAAIQDSWFERYHVYKHHIDWLFTLQRLYPNNSRIAYSGESFEGNNITGIHIFGGSGGGIKPAVVFHGTVHAREWITGKAVEYMAYSLLANYSVDSEMRDFVEKYDFYIFPIVNPDGFIRTHKDRMWRKTRQSESQSTCLGRDINRNWPFQWDTVGGSSTDPCAQDFRGQAEGDAPETQALIERLQDIKDQQGLKLYIDWHSYSQLFMWAYGYSCDKFPENYEELQALGKGAVAEMAKPYGTVYTAGSICPTIYMASGSSVDYVQDVVGADYVYAVELRDKGKNGFLLPKEEILPTSLEAFEGVKYLLRNMK